MLYRRSIMCDPRRYQGPANRFQLLGHHEDHIIAMSADHPSAFTLHTSPLVMPGAVSS